MKSQFGQYRTALAIAAVALLLFNGWLLHSNFEKVAKQESLVQHSSDVSIKLELILTAALDTETGVRGFVLTRQQQFLEPFRKGERDLATHMLALKALVRDPAQKANVAAIEATLADRLRILNEFRTKTENGTLTPAARADILEEGKLVMDSLREQIARAQDKQRAILAARSVEAQQSREFFTLAVILTTLFSALVVGAAFQQFRRNQIRAELDAVEKAEESWATATLGELGSSLAGDVSADVAAGKLANVLAERFGFLVSKTFLRMGSKLELFSQSGEGEFEVSVDERSLLTTALAKGEVWEVTDLPGDHVKIRSTLGESSPKVVVFVPVTFQGQVIGIIEAGAAGPLDQAKREVLRRSSEVIGVGLNAARTREQLKDLLERTQQQAEELEAQQEELRTNNEELEQQARALESQQQSLNIQNRELEEARRDLEAKANDLERASQYKSDFMAKMSHELRTPLNGLLILATLLQENKEKNLSERQIQFAKSIQGAGQDLLSLINDILDLSKIEARKLSIRAEDFKLADVLEHKKITFGPQAQAKNLDLAVEIDPTIKDLDLFTDRQRLEQILRNFVSNALKFTDTGSVTIAAKPKGPNRIQIAVRDTGIGIPQDKQALIFEAFEQVESADRSFGGTGLGLTIARELADLLGGSISVTSQVGKGSAFILDIPIRLETAEATKETAQASNQPSTSSLLAPRPRQVSTSGLGANERSEMFYHQAQEIIGEVPRDKRTILVVEDDDGFRKSVAETVSGFGFHPLEAGDGELALKILENFTPDAILLDIKLPGISGLGLLEMIKQLPQLRHVPVHMISALDYQQNALKRGALGYLTKPVTIEKVRSAITRIENFINEKVRKVLVIEDDQRQSEAISALISGNDVKVVAAKYGREAVEKIKSETFDCIILDLTLPDLSGIDLLAELNKLPISLPPIVIYTGKDLSPKEEDYLRKFSDSIIIKGARSPERLLDEVNLFLHRVESLLPTDKREMLVALRKQDSAFDGKTVLIADDDMRNIFALTNALESKGLNVRIAKDGVDAVEQLESHDDIDLVLMDIMMPRMDGYEAMKKIRSSENSRVRSTPMISLTAKAMREDHERCIQAGANDYIPKPVNLQNLFTAMKVWLEPKGYV